jgi:prepilin peptidase CpaA
MAWAGIALFAALALAGAYSDARFRTISNALTVPMALAGLTMAWLTAGPAAAGSAAEHFAVALLIGIAAFAGKLWGGGDAKFYAATAAWFSLSAFTRLIMAISIAGLILVVAWRAGSRLRGGRGSKPAQVPYGIAIAAGGLMAMGLG